MDRQYSTRFLDAFINIEQILEDKVRPKRHRPFYQLVDAVAQMDPFVHDIALELKEYGDLRNAIVHERINNEPIAEPHPEVVERIERIRDLLRQPPKVADEFLRPVFTCKPTDRIDYVAGLMYKHGFSKIPVYDETGFIGLLTAEAITHWLGATWDDKKTTQTHDLRGEPVSTVLAYVGENTRFQFVCKECTVFEVMRLFEEASHYGQRLQAVIITDDGSQSSPPLGIITAFDLPKIYDLINNR